MDNGSSLKLFQRHTLNFPFGVGFHHHHHCRGEPFCWLRNCCYYSFTLLINFSSSISYPVQVSHSDLHKHVACLPTNLLQKHLCIAQQMVSVQDLKWQTLPALVCFLHQQSTFLFCLEFRTLVLFFQVWLTWYYCTDSKWPKKLLIHSPQDPHRLFCTLIQAEHLQLLHCPTETGHHDL